MNVVGAMYFGIVTQEGPDYRARVEIPERPPVVVVTREDGDLTDEVSAALADVLGITSDEVDVHLFGHSGGDGTPVYAGAAVFNGSEWLTQFPAQEDLPVALSVPPSPTYDSAEHQARKMLADAVGRPADDLDIEFFEIVPHEFA
ncbi:hypothetical protein ACQEU8_20075 [Streptomyces sp. CA-250714]|uniref:hypothetical protein n=1 Tax=Streptomyces sp. CA-250714 TaxID=3240060 RepID=UPI003D902ACC